MKKDYPDYCELTFKAEGGYLPTVLRPHWPGGVSGVTIGPGYDMGHRSAASIKADLKAANVPDADVDKLAESAGLTGSAAGDWVDGDGKDVAKLTNEMSMAIFNYVYPTYVERTKGIVKDWGGDWDTYPQPMKEVLVDLTYRGDLAKKHKPHLSPSVTSGDYRAFRAAISDHTYWQDNTNLPDMKNGGPNLRITDRSAWLPESPAGATGSACFPVDTGAGTKVTAESVAALYKHTEVDHKGGYFPLGSNTVWHGGVHLRVKKGTPVLAAFDGRIVAARLSDAPDEAQGHYGDRNFVLLEHEVAGSTLNKMIPVGKLIGFVVTTQATNMRDQASTSGAVVAQLVARDELDLVEEKYVEAGGLRWAHVKVKSAADAPKVGKQGFVAVKDAWYLARRESAPGGKLDDAKIYKFYSLSMHLRGEALDAGNKALAGVKWLLAPPPAPPPAYTGSIAESVGEGGKNRTDDVRAVQQRLTEHGHYKGAVNGTCDAPTIAAIKAFQGTYSRSPDGRVDPGGKTWKELCKPPSKAAAPAFEPALVSALRTGDVVKLDKRVAAGDVLWTSGEYGSPGHRAELIHWEVFSEDNLMPGFTPVEDTDDDFNMDIARIKDLIQQERGFWESDDILTLDEIVDFYARQPNARALRAYACKFLNEWAVDLDKAIPAMMDANRFTTYGLKERMAPHLWWKEAAGKQVPLPASAKCWHYNPIAFAAARAKIPPAQSEAAGAAAESTPAATDHVYAQREGQRVPHFAQTDSKWGSRTLGSDKTISAAGCAICSVAMILKYYGRDVTPETLDQHLDDNSGYSGDSVNWGVAFAYNEGTLKLTDKGKVTSGFKDVLDKRIADNKPTLARVRYGTSTSGYNHFVVISGRHKDGQYIMNDPGSESGNGAASLVDDNLIEKTTRKTGYTLVQLDLWDPA